MPTGRASLCALGEYRRRPGVFAPLREPGTIPQKTGRQRPFDTRLDGLLGILWGAKTFAQRHGTIRVDPAVQRALGRTGCAEQSTMAHPVQASIPETVDHRSRGAWYDRKRSGQTPHHRCAERLLGVELEVPPLPMGAPAAGRGRPWMGRHRSKTGRQVRRWTARADRERLHATRLREKTSAVPAHKAALGDLATRLGWPRERRQRMVLRLAGGCGPTEVFHGLLSRGSQVVATIRHSGRVRQLRQALGPWQPTSSHGRESAAVCRPHRLCRATRQGVMRTPKEQGG